MNPASSEAIIYEKKRLPQAVKKGGLIIILGAVVLVGGWYSFNWWQAQQLAALREQITLVEVDPSFVHQQPDGYLIYEAPSDYLPKSLAKQFSLPVASETAMTETEIIPEIINDDSSPVASDEAAETVDTDITEVVPTTMIWLRDIINNLDITLDASTIPETTILNPWSIVNGNLVYQLEGETRTVSKEGGLLSLTATTIVQPTYDGSYLFVANNNSPTFEVYRIDPETKKVTLEYTTDITLGTIMSLQTAPDLHRVVVLSSNAVGTYLSYYDAYTPTVIKSEQISDFPVQSLKIRAWVNENPLQPVPVVIEEIIIE